MTKNVKRIQRRIKVRMHHTDAINTSVPRPTEVHKPVKVWQIVDDKLMKVEETPISADLEWQDFEIASLMKAGATDLLKNNLNISRSSFVAADNLDNLAANLDDSVIYKPKTDE